MSSDRTVNEPGKHILKAMREKTRLNRILLDNMPCIALLLRPHTREIVASNQAAARVGAVPRKQCYAAWARRETPCPFCRAPLLWASGQPQHLEVEYGGAFWDAHWIPISDDLYMHYAFDVTDRKQSEKELAAHREHLEELVRERTRQLDQSRERLRMAERLTAIGRLAAGVAHEINNPIGAVLTSAETALAVKDDPKARELLDRCLGNIVSSAKRCGEIVEKLLEFAEEESGKKRSHNLNDVVRSAVDAARERIDRRDVTIELESLAEAPRAVVNPLQIEKALVNLIQNASESGASLVHVSLETDDTAGIVRILVRDDGRGLTKEERRRIFEPFYSTRKNAGAAGMGVSVAYGIVRDHGGSVRVESEPRKGATVVVELPAASGDDAPDRSESWGSNGESARH